MPYPARFSNSFANSLANSFANSLANSLAKSRKSRLLFCLRMFYFAPSGAAKSRPSEAGRGSRQ